MQEQQNIDLIKKLYQAFGQGDINTLIAHLADDFVWRFDAPSVIPYAGDQKTHDEVRNAIFGSLWQCERGQMLKPEEFIAQGDKVVVIGRYHATVAATGKSFDVAKVHEFTIQKRQSNAISRFH